MNGKKRIEFESGNREGVIDCFKYQVVNLFYSVESGWSLDMLEEDRGGLCED